MGNKLGKTPDTNKLKKRRCQSITWNFRYSTIKKNKKPVAIMVAATQHKQVHLDIGQWLTILELTEYESHFREFSGVEQLIELNEGDIKQLGINNSAHRARIVSSLVVLREKYENQNNSKNVQDNNNIDATTGANRTAVEATNLENKEIISHAPDSIKSRMRSSMTIDRSNSSIDVKDSSEIYEVLDNNIGDHNTNKPRTKQSKSCGDLLDMDGSVTPTPTTPTSAENQEAIVLKKALEWEFSLDSRDLRSHAWYHGSIPRQRAEEIVQKDGDFLIRDCASQPGNYVLSCRTKPSVLHFVINKILLQPETVYERVQYQFEDDAYDTVPDLITFYVGSGKAISAASGARIQFPCNRTYPLSFYGNKVVGNQYHSQMMAGLRGVSPLNSPSLANAGLRFNPYTQQQGNYNNTYRSPMSSPPRTKRETPPRLPSKKQRSQSLTPAAQAAQSATDKYCSADSFIQHPDDNRSSLQSISSEKCCSADGVIQSNQTNGSARSQIELLGRSNDEKCTSADGVIKQNGTNQSQLMSRSAGDTNLKTNTNSMPRNGGGSNLRLSSSRSSSISRDGSETTLLSPCAEHNQNGLDGNHVKAPSPPPKPSRTPAAQLPLNNTRRENFKDLPLEQQQHPLNRVTSYHASGSDSGNGSGDSAQSSAAGDPLLEIVTPHRGVIIKNPRFMTNSVSSMTLKSFSDFDIVAAEQDLANMEIPIIEQQSKFDLENFQTLLLPSVDNKPLDSDALNTFRMMLSETGPRIIAQHLTRIDIKLILGDFEKQTVTSDHNNVLECNGIELLTLPHGQLFRSDLIERTQCLKLLVAITILTCQSDLERAETLDKWIQVAVETKTALGNLFGFCCIMLGLCMSQVQKLEQTWHILRQKFTDSAFTFEAKLRPTLKNMNDCTNPQAPNTTVPHLLPYILLKDRGIDDILMIGTASALTNQSSLLTSCISSWETNADDFGISILFAHLDSARFFTKNFTLYKRNCQIVIENSNSRLDELLSDAFRTEFHIKFLWGSKGSTVAAEDRHAKLEQVLALMADKFCLVDQIGCAG